MSHPHSRSPFASSGKSFIGLGYIPPGVAKARAQAQEVTQTSVQQVVAQPESRMSPVDRRVMGFGAQPKR